MLRGDVHAQSHARVAVICERVFRLRARAAAVESPVSAPRSGPKRASRARSCPKRVASGHRGSTEPIELRPLATIAPGTRRYAVVEHGGDLTEIARVIAEFSTLELAQALLRSELEIGNGAAIILDQQAKEAILDATSYPVRVSLRPAGHRRSQRGVGF